MGVLRFFVFLFLQFLVVHAKSNCQPSFCSPQYLPIRFPFRLPDQPEDCGFPGFDLISCNIAGHPVLNLTFYGSFDIRDIDYKSQIIELYDPYRCQQNRLMKLNLSSSPFKAVSYMNYTLVTCSFYALEWDTPNCKDCEATGISCELKNSTSREVQCLGDPWGVNPWTRNPPKVDPPKGEANFGAIITAVIVPIMSFSGCYVCYQCQRDAEEEDNHYQENPTSQNSMATITAIEPPASDHVASDLDDDDDMTAIESDATVVTTLDESRRLAGP